MRKSIYGDTGTVQILLDAGADPDIQDKDGKTALYLATLYGKTKTVKALLDAGASLDIQDKDGKTALYWAGNEEITKLLQRSNRKRLIAYICQRPLL